MVVYFAAQVPHRRSAEGWRAHPRIDSARAGVVDHSVPHHHRDLRLGVERLLRLQRPPDQTLEIYATGKRWMWRFQHLDGQNEINELHVPVGRPVKVTFTSEDVLHSTVSSRRFGSRRTPFPGATARSGSRRRRWASIHLFCAEYCGTNHSGMVGTSLRHGADRLRGVADRQRGRRLAGRARRAALQRSRVQHLSPQ